MGNRVILHIQNKLRSLGVTIKASLVSWATIFISLIGGAFLFGRYTMEAQKDKEFTEINTEHNLNISNLEHQHQAEIQSLNIEIKEKDKESAMWKEKYFQLLLDKCKDNNSP